MTLPQAIGDGPCGNLATGELSYLAHTKCSNTYWVEYQKIELKKCRPSLSMRSIEFHIQLLRM